MNLSKVYNPKEVETKIYRFWLKTGFFNPDKLPPPRKKSYCIVIPPPNITGQLHIGHALNAIAQDILIRKKRMEGNLALWLPGIDHAGIAAQTVVERELKKKGIGRFDLGRENFLKKMWEWKKKYGNTILNQLKKLGSSCDWSRTRFTLDKDYCQAVKEAFFHYYRKGWIYRDQRVINWCPRCQTSLSDLELEYHQLEGKLWYIRYLLKIKNQKVKIKTANQNLKRKKYIVVATTRPETMLGDAAVAVNPKDQRYKNLIGKKVILPLVGREIPIVAEKSVDPKFGTGAVKVTPAHDLKDYQIGKIHNLPMIQVIGKMGEITTQAPKAYRGLTTLEARKKIVKDLKARGWLEKVENYLYEIPKCYRCQTIIELIPSWQWFLKMPSLAKLAIEAVKRGEIKFFPKRFEKTYFDWLENVKDWCISRQIWWGHPLPVWFCQADQLNSKLKTQNSKSIYFISLHRPKKCPICKKCRPKQVLDVLDTWFSSALWPLATLGWPKKTKDLKRFYPTDVLVTDREIINLWVARMIFSGLEFMKKIPFRKVYIHPTVLTREGKRMSKTLGTGVDPIDLIQNYGADATRFGLAFQIMGGQDLKFIQDNILMGKKFCNKIWNATRFVLQQITKSKLKGQNSKISLKFRNKNLTVADKKILKALNETIKSVNKDLENFQFGKSAHKLYDFFWHNFCDQYIEISKFQMANKKLRKQTLKILLKVLLTCLKLLHPFIPFITEEIYQKLPIPEKKKSLMVENWPKIK